MPDVAETDYYERLGLAQKASPAEIRKAYHRLARLYHPDKQPVSDDHLRAIAARVEGEQRGFLEISRAYQVLSDVRERAEYDLRRAQRASGPVSSGFTWSRGSAQHDLDLDDFNYDAPRGLFTHPCLRCSGEFVLLEQQLEDQTLQQVSENSTSKNGQESSPPLSSIYSIEIECQGCSLRVNVSYAMAT